jgi:chromosome segregation ATPase
MTCSKHSPKTTEFAARGVGANQLKPALLYLSGCEFELATLAKAENKDPSIISEHCAAAQIWLQKVFGVQDPLRAQSKAKENQVIIKEGPFKNVNDFQSSKARDNSQGYPKIDRDIKRMERELQSLRDRNANQGKHLAQLRSIKRKLEDDYFYERDLRRKYQRQRDSLEEELKSARKMEKHALEQITREVAARRTAQETLVEMKTALGTI